MLLVTGITGHTGRYFVQQLIENNFTDPIRCVIRNSSNTGMIDNSTLNIEKVIGDLNDTEFIDKIMVGVESIVHIYNIHHSPIIMQAAMRNNVKRIIMVHTTGIYSKYKHASNEYKTVEAKILELSKLPDCQTSVTILRPTMIYGDLCDKNMSKFIRIIDKIRIVPVINKGSNFIQPINARDLGKSLFSVLTFPSTIDKSYNLSGYKPIKILEILQLISKELNKKTLFINVPLSAGVMFAKLLKVISVGKFDFIERIQRMGEDRSYSHENASKDFGYSPMSFEIGIHKEVQEYLYSRVK